MKRKDFIRNALMAVAVSPLPKLLLPQEVKPEEMVEKEIRFAITMNVFDFGDDGKYKPRPPEEGEMGMTIKLKVPKSRENDVEAYFNELMEMKKDEPPKEIDFIKMAEERSKEKDANLQS